MTSCQKAILFYSKYYYF